MAVLQCIIMECWSTVFIYQDLWNDGSASVGMKSSPCHIKLHNDTNVILDLTSDWILFHRHWCIQMALQWKILKHHCLAEMSRLFSLSNNCISMSSGSKSTYVAQNHWSAGEWKALRWRLMASLSELITLQLNVYKYMYKYTTRVRTVYHTHTVLFWSVFSWVYSTFVGSFH